MKLAVWTYEGPPHVGAMRIATAMKGVHFVLHAPQGDTYADLLFTMIERRDRRPPVTYTTFQARDLGGDTAELFKTAVRDAYDRFKPDAMLVGASCTAELIQDDPGGLADALGLPIPVVALELPSYQKKENWGAAETFYQIVRALNAPAAAATSRGVRGPRDGRRPLCNLLGPTALGFRHRDDITEVRKLLESIGVDVGVIAPMGASIEDIRRLPDADFNVVLFPEIAAPAADWLKRTFGQPIVSIVPIGVGATRDFIAKVREVAGLTADAPVDVTGLRAPWYSRSIDSTYLTGKRVFIFGDATHVIAAARIAASELGFEVAGLGTYTREHAREVRAAATALGVEALVTDDYLEVEARIIALQPELVLGTQMERHIAKRLGIPSAVISAPVHVQDYPARYAPQMGAEGANVIFDTWVHPLMMGLEEHLITLFKDDFEFHESSGPSHLHASAKPSASHAAEAETAARAETAASAAAGPALIKLDGLDPSLVRWAPDAEAELRKIPFFVRGRARRNTETFAASRGFGVITLETLYDAKVHFSR